MRLDYVVHKRSTLSAPQGYLQTDGNKVTFTKYKNQLEGRMNWLLYIIYSIYLSFIEDKVIVDLDKKDIKEVIYNVAKGSTVMGMSVKYNELKIKTTDSELLFYIDPQYDQEKVEAFIEEAKS